MSTGTTDTLRGVTLILAGAAWGVGLDRLGLMPLSPVLLVLCAVWLIPVARRVAAIRSLRRNYTWKGVWIWLKGRKRSTGRRGITMVLLDPAKVIANSEAAAAGNAT
jgi:hypothetical protein